jgi:hypothetical protein
MSLKIPFPSGFDFVPLESYRQQLIRNESRLLELYNGIPSLSNTMCKLVTGEDTRSWTAYDGNDIWTRLVRLRTEIVETNPDW